LNKVLNENIRILKDSKRELEYLFDTSLSRYVEILEMASKGRLPANIDLDSLRHRPIKELIECGMLSFCESTYNKNDPTKILAVTPEGAVALVNWRKILREGSIVSTVIESFSKLLWILVGVLCATLPKLIAS